MSDQILKMIDQIDNQSLFAECDVMCSLANSYTKEMMILEADDESAEKKSKVKTFIEKVKNFFKKLFRMIQILIARIKKCKIDFIVKRINVYIDKNNITDVDCDDPYDMITWMNDIIKKLHKSFKIEGDAISSDAATISMLAATFRTLAGNIEKKKRWWRKSDAEMAAEVKKYYDDDNWVIISGEAYKAYLKSITAFLDLITQFSIRVNLAIDSIIKSAEAYIKEKSNFSGAGDVFEDYDENDKVTYGFIPENPQKWADLASNMIKFTSVFMHNMTDELDHMLGAIMLNNGTVYNDLIENQKKLMSVKKDRTAASKRAEKALHELDPDTQWYLSKKG